MFFNQIFKDYITKQNILILHDTNQPESGLICIKIVQSFLFEKLKIFDNCIYEYMYTKLPNIINKRLNYI